MKIKKAVVVGTVGLLMFGAGSLVPLAFSHADQSCVDVWGNSTCPAPAPTPTPTPTPTPSPDPATSAPVANPAVEPVTTTPQTTCP